MLLEDDEDEEDDEALSIPWWHRCPLLKRVTELLLMEWESGRAFLDAHHGRIKKKSCAIVNKAASAVRAYETQHGLCPPGVAMLLVDDISRAGDAQVS